ncbi:NAD-dependent epimerase/dehydratase family protein [Fulvivirga sp. M361]|uniref:NAD-dependent epimerase/dehydratase family protein n=1 Tax=Fulvivirga sp. M361 TaxID=2594266 RepID=UPI00117B1AB1|nr:NAD-dependent epimerase/dehydratase family protein [Fulvivirga sp. M361]TRX55603.1 NAD-dependent epimerase/dehydratase family protein [Fulvivirga sp. M361]
MKKVIITGGNGFIGRALVQKLLLAGYQTEIITKQNQKSDLPVKTHPIGLGDKEKIKEILNTDVVVIHLAWSTVPVTSAIDSKNDVISNLPDSLNIIEACVENGVSNLLFFSSGGTVYGNPQKLPIDERHPTNPLSPYGIDKLMVEKYILMYSSRFSLPFTILRVSNAYGFNYRLTKPQGVIGHWVNNLKKGETLELVGEGNTIRDFIHVDDICNATMLLLEKPSFEIYNLGSQIGFSLKELFMMLEECLGRKLKTSRLSERSFDVSSNVLSIDKIKQHTGWEPLKQLRQEIVKILNKENVV